MRYEEIYLSEVSFVGGLYSLFLAILILENDSRPTTTYMSFREGERERETGGIGIYHFIFHGREKKKQNAVWHI